MGPPYSHPPENGHDGVFLDDHLTDVAERVEFVVPDDAETPTGESLRTVIETLALVHDFGKATTHFQQYLLNGKSPDREAYRYHAPLGSFAAYYALDVQGFDPETCLSGFVTVAKHHGKLPDVAEYVIDRTHRRETIDEENQREERQSVVMQQIKDIHDNVPELASDVFDTATKGNGDWISFAQGYESLLSEIEATVGTTGQGYGVNRDALSTSCYGLVIQCWSALVLADKTSAAGASNEPTTYTGAQPSLQRLDEYIEEIQADTCADKNGSRTERLNFHRAKARTDVLENVSAFAEGGGGIATLTLPTGMGKTLTGLSAAFSLRDKLEGERVVYALPFTSIIDQVVNEVGEIYRTDIAGRLLTAHHHLSETVIRDEEDPDEADRNDDIAGMLAESWRAGLTVTTFVQLFESLAGPSNGQSMKLPALKDSVIILDEPQSLPLDWWKLVPRLTEMLTEQYDASVIAMTATQPKLFEDTAETDSVELVDSPDAYFDTTDRVSYTLDRSAERYISEQDGPKTYDAAATQLCEAIDSEESTLAICNTIDSARTLTDRLIDSNTSFVNVAEEFAAALSEHGSVESINPTTIAKQIKTVEGTPVLHLSTRLRPADRLKLIETAKELTDRGCPLLTMSTQLVEAGVDISFEQVYRDLAPIDSIVQAAGRCNRSFERDEGRVTVWWLDNPNEQTKTPAEAVYNRGTSLLPVAAETLESVRGNQKTLSETAVAQTAVQAYYDRLHENRDVGKQTYADYVDDAKADKLGELSLIDQRRAADILVCRTATERNLVERLRTANREYDFEQLRRLLSETKPFRISVPYYREDSEIADAITDLPRLIGDEGIYVLDVRDHGSYFDRSQGFVVPESTVENQFL